MVTVTYDPASKDQKFDSIATAKAFFGSATGTPVAQQTHIADPAAMASITATGPAACASITQGTYTASVALTDPPTKAEMEAELALIDAELDKIKVDTGAIKTAVDANNAEIDALIVDVTAAKTAVDANNAVIDAILVLNETFGFVATS